MTRRAAYGCAVVLALLGLLVTPVAQAADAQVPRITLRLSSTTITSGSPLVVAARANALCDWIVEFSGERRHTIGRSVRTTFTAPVVTERSRLSVVVTCVVHTPPRPPQQAGSATGSGSQHDAQAVMVQIPARATLDPPVTVLPDVTVEPPHGPGGGHPGGLPSTGGPSRWLLIAGLTSLLLGSVLVRLRRRSLPASPA